MKPILTKTISKKTAARLMQKAIDAGYKSKFGLTPKQVRKWTHTPVFGVSVYEGTTTLWSFDPKFAWLEIVTHKEFVKRVSE